MRAGAVSPVARNQFITSGHTGTTSDNTLATPPFPVPPFLSSSSSSGGGNGGARDGGDSDAGPADARRCNGAARQGCLKKKKNKK